MTHEGFADGFTKFLDQIGAETVGRGRRPRADGVDGS